MIDPDRDPDPGERLARLMEHLSSSDYLTAAFCPDRPYDGQPYTNTGERGRTEVRGLTLRDLRDCFLVGCYQSSGLPSDEYPRSLYKLPWREIDPLAVFENMACEIERRMGIFPNMPGLCDKG